MGDDGLFWWWRFRDWIALASKARHYRRENERLRNALPWERDRHGYVPCYRCGHDCGMDFHVPLEIWLQISPTGSQGGMLCIWCADVLCVEKGIEYRDVRIYFSGEGLGSQLYPEDLVDKEPGFEEHGFRAQYVGAKCQVCGELEQDPVHMVQGEEDGAVQDQ